MTPARRPLLVETKIVVLEFIHDHVVFAPFRIAPVPCLHALMKGCTLLCDSIACSIGFLRCQSGAVGLNCWSMCYVLLAVPFHYACMLLGQPQTDWGGAMWGADECCSRAGRIRGHQGATRCPSAPEQLGRCNPPDASKSAFLQAVRSDLSWTLPSLSSQLEVDSVLASSGHFVP